jgi:hypothetical protein
MMDDDECDVDVCQHCGGYFAWTERHKQIAQERGFYGPGYQRCIRCMVDECWIERDDE